MVLMNPDGKSVSGLGRNLKDCFRGLTPRQFHLLAAVPFHERLLQRQNDPSVNQKVEDDTDKSRFGLIDLAMGRP